MTPDLGEDGSVGRAGPIDVSPLAVLLGQVAVDRRWAFEELYAALAPTALRIMQAVLLDRGQAEEVAQEVFVHIWQRAGQFDPSKGSAASWIWRTAHSRAVDRVRHAQSVRTNDSRYARHLFEREVDSVVEVVLAGTDAASLHRSLECLTALQRQALLMTYFAGRSNLEASALLAIPLPTLKSRVLDALTSLRRLHGNASGPGTSTPQRRSGPAVDLHLGSQGPAPRRRTASVECLTALYEHQNNAATTVQ